MAVLITLQVAVLWRYAETAQSLQHTQAQLIEKSENLNTVNLSKKTLQEEKTGIESSLREFRQKSEVLEQENADLKVDLQAKEQTEASQVQTQVVAAAPQPAAQPAAAVSGSCEDWLAQAGITDKANARVLISRESGCNPFADNPTSDAYGIPQALPGHKMASHGADWATNPVTQLRWMQDYVTARYGSWANAVGHSTAMGWY